MICNDLFLKLGSSWPSFQENKGNTMVTCLPFPTANSELARKFQPNFTEGERSKKNLKTLTFFFIKLETGETKEILLIFQSGKVNKLTLY